MNPLTLATQQIKYRIPPELLRIAFRGDGWRHAPLSIDEQILSKVIGPRVLIDCNLVGGVYTMISLQGLVPDYIDNLSVVYRIPFDRTNNRAILSALSIGYLPHATALGAAAQGFSYVTPGSMNTVTQAAQRIGDSVSAMVPISNAFVELIGTNVVLMRDPLRIQSSYVLKCILENDPNMLNLNPRSYPDFIRLCELAVKSYIYNTLIVKIDQGYLEAGQELGSIKSVIEGYADSEEMYQTFLRETWAKVAFMNDVNLHDQFIKMQVCPGL